MHSTTTPLSSKLHQLEKNVVLPCEQIRQRTSSNKIEVTITSSAIMPVGNSVSADRCNRPSPTSNPVFMMIIKT